MAAPSLRQARAYHSSCALGTSVYVFGGVGGGCAPNVPQLKIERLVDASRNAIVQQDSTNLRWYSINCTGEVPMSV